MPQPNNSDFVEMNDEFYKACSGSEIESLPFPFGEVLASPNAETFSISSPSIQLSLGGLLSSRARLCFTGRQEFKRDIGAVNQRQKIESNMTLRTAKW